MTMFDNVRNALRATGNVLAQALGLNGRLTETNSREHLTNPDDAVVTISRVAGSPGRRVAGSPGRRVAGSPGRRVAQPASVGWAMNLCGAWRRWLRSPASPSEPSRSAARSPGAGRRSSSCGGPVAPSARSGRFGGAAAGLRRSILALTCLLLAGLSSQAYAQSPTVQLSASSYTVVEGDAVLVAVELSASRSQATTVTLSSHQNTATSGTDFTAGPYTVSIPAGQTRGTVSIQTTQDSVLEGDEDFDVSITGASPATTVGSRGRATITIEDDEYTVDLGRVSYLVDENAGVYRHTVTLSKALRKDVLIYFTYTDYTTTPFVHYTPVHASAHGQAPLRIPAGQTNAVLEIPIHDDTDFAPNRLLQITAVNPDLPDGESNDSTQFIIRNIDDLIVPSSITAVAGRTLRVAVERIPRADTVPVTFVVELADDAQAAEFGAGPHRFTIPAGRFRGTVDIPVTADADTAVETISLLVNVERTGTLLASTTATIYPLSNVIPTVSITADSAQVEEGGMATFTVTASPAPPVDMDVQVRYFANGGAFVTPDENHVATIPANGRTVSIPIITTVDPSNADGVIHAVLLDRHDTLNGSGVYPYRVRGKESVASDGTPIGGSAASIAVMDGPDVPQLKVKLLRFSPRTVEEGTDLDFYLNVNFAPESDLPVNLSIREGPGTFAPGGDYVAADTLTATIPAGERGVAFSIPTVNDEVEEPNAIVRVTAVGGTGYTVSKIRLWDVTVTDDDGPEGLGSEQNGAQDGATPLPVVTIAADATSVTEGGDVTFTVTSDPAPANDLPVNVGVAQEMGAGGNRVGSSWFDMVTIRAGTTSATWTVTTMSDDVARADGEAVGRILWGNDYREGATSKVRVALIDDDGGTADTDGAPEPTSVTTQTGPQGVPLALVAEVKGHIAHFKARNHGAGVRDWTLVLDRLEGRTGMSDAAIAAWLARSRQYGWQDGIQTLPKVQAALAALAAVPQQQPATLPVVTIAADAASVTEGGTAAFTLTATPPPPADLTVTVGVAATGDYGIASASRTVTIPTTGSFTLTLATTGDTTDEPDGSVTVTVADGAGYTVGSSASGTVSVRDDDLPPPAVSITAAAASVTEGGAASFTVSADRAPDADLTVTLAVTEAAGGDHVAADDEGPGTVTIAKGATEASFSVPTVDDAVDEPDGSVTVTVAAGAGYTVSSSRGAATVAVSDNDAAAGPVLSVADATVTEGDWAELMPFAVRLSAAAAQRVRVRASTRVSSPVSARPKEDYWPQSELVTFYPGETEKTVWVYIYNDSHDEDPETFEVVLSNADGATIGDGVAVGTIVNDDPMPAAWLARFGRTVAEQALDGIAGRMAAPRAAGMQGTLAGQALSFDPAANDNASGAAVPGATGALALADVARSFDNRPDRFGNGGFGNAPGSLSGTGGAGLTQSRTMTARDALLGSSFSLTGEADGSGGSMAFWGRAAQGSFDGREGTFSLDGAVTTGMLGADYARGKSLVGLALAQSEGEGDYRDSDVSPRPDGQSCPDGGDGPLCGDAVRAGDGSVEASLTAAIPYAALQASERLKLWGAAGYGTGEVTLKTAMGGSYSSDTTWSMAAAGLRGDLLEAPAEGSGPALAVTSDALWTRTSSEKTRDLAASDSDATRLRLGLEGSYRMALEGGGHLTPKLEVGARHDGGDAETGFGVELGGGVAWVDPGLGLSLDVSGRTLIAHGNDDLKDRGYAASLAFDPDPATRRGPSLSLRQEFGGQANGGLDALFQPATLEDRSGSEATSRWAMEAAYGFPAFGGRWTGSPHVGLGLATAARDYSLGWRLTPEGRTAANVSFGLKATRRESAAQTPEHTVGVEITARW